MPLTKSKGNMYPWVTHTHTHIGGKCPHECSYCYVQAMERRFGGTRYSGELRLIEKELEVDYGSGKTIFVDHCNDLWADAVQDEWIDSVLDHCFRYPHNTYVFQTKNPQRYHDLFHKIHRLESVMLGCTIETNDTALASSVSKAPPPYRRAYCMELLCGIVPAFITIEPILKGSMVVLADMIGRIQPSFVNIGADSKGTGLDEPSGSDVLRLIDALNEYGIEIKQKRNLERLLQQERD